MGQKWIIDVLSDLQAFAQKNDLPLLADQLVLTARVAQAEIAPLTKGAPLAVVGDGAEAGQLSGETGTGPRA